MLPPPRAVGAPGCTVSPGARGVPPNPLLGGLHPGSWHPAPSTEVDRLPLRPLPPTTPAQEVDYCGCRRGYEALRWVRAGFEAPEALLDLVDSTCSRCNAQGLVIWAGWIEPVAGLGYGVFMPAGPARTLRQVEELARLRVLRVAIRSAVRKIRPWRDE